jgi:hypothetical protein
VRRSKLNKEQKNSLGEVLLAVTAVHKMLENEGNNNVNELG